MKQALVAQDGRQLGAPLWWTRPHVFLLAVTLPMFLVIPALLRGGMNFYLALAIGCLITVGLYAAMIALAPRVGIRL